MNGHVQRRRLACPRHRNAQRHTDFTHANFQLISGSLNRVVNIFRSPFGNGFEFITHHFQRLTRNRTQVFLGRVGVERVKLFIEVTAAFSNFFQRFATLAKQLHQIRQFRARTGIDVCLFNVPLQISRHIFWLHGIDVVMVQPQQFVSVERAG